MGDKMKFNDDDHGGLYEPTDSEDNYSDEEKELLAKVRQGKKRPQTSQDVLAFDESEEEEAADDDDDVGELMGDSDIEGAGENDGADIPDDKAWGRKVRDYYNTDFVDPDFSSYTEKELEMAQQEEEEALSIQRRLAQQMNEADFVFDLPAAGDSADEDDETAATGKKSKKKQTETYTKLTTDLSGLSKKQKSQMFAKDSPEFFGLVEDLFTGLEDCEKLLNPVLSYAAQHKLPNIPALEFARVMNTLLTTYCSNINFYLMLKANRTTIKNHPITKRLVQLKTMIEQLSDRYDNIIKPQLEALLERIEDGDVIEFVLQTAAKEPSAQKKKQKKSLEPTSKRIKLDAKADELKQSSDDEEDDDDDSAQEEGETEDGAAVEEMDEDERRGITYQISKNRGLTPHRKKELRNPRVKHRGKYRKALIRRKGAVRTVRTESKRYGGEMSGIKSTVSKSVKFK